MLLDKLDFIQFWLESGKACGKKMWLWHNLSTSENGLTSCSNTEFNINLSEQELWTQNCQWNHSKTDLAYVFNNFQS